MRDKMAQLDMRPEEVQFHSKGLVEDVKSMAELLRQLEAAVQELDQSWTSNEKEAYKAAVYKDIEDLKKVLVRSNQQLFLKPKLMSIFVGEMRCILRIVL